MTSDTLLSYLQIRLHIAVYPRYYFGSDNNTVCSIPLKNFWGINFKFKFFVTLTQLEYVLKFKFKFHPNTHLLLRLLLFVFIYISNWRMNWNLNCTGTKNGHNNFCVNVRYIKWKVIQWIPINYFLFDNLFFIYCENKTSILDVALNEEKS